MIFLLLLVALVAGQTQVFTCDGAHQANASLCGDRAPIWSNETLCDMDCSTVCCRDFLCGEQLNSGSCYPLVLNTSAPCTGSCDTSECCHEATCADRHAEDASFCRYGGKIWDFGLNFTAACTQNCAVDECCNPTVNCQEMPQLGFSCSFGFGLDSSFRPCTDCVKECCLPLTCNALFGTSPSLCYDNQKHPTTNNTLLYDSCGEACNLDTCCVNFCGDTFSSNVCPSNLFLDYSAECTGCTLAECCQQPQTCLEARQIGQISCDVAYQYIPDQACVNCNSSAECCKTISTCQDAAQAQTLDCRSLGLVTKVNTSCTGSDCSTDVCCRAALTCPEMPSSICTEFALVYDFQGTCTGECSYLDCCRPAANCVEMYEASGFGLCSGLGEVTMNVCTGAGCNSSLCCREPETCSEVQRSTIIPGFGSRWCNLQGFADSTQQLPCSGECTAATCCMPKTCAEFGGSEMLFCSIGGVVDRTRACDVDAGCSEESCCRPAAICQETPFAYLCPSNTYPLPKAVCSGASCNETTCCAPAHTCAEANKNFLFCSTVGLQATSVGICNGTCTTAQCCVAPTSCNAIAFCPEGTQNVYNKPCDGDQCTTNNCCISVNRTCNNEKTGFCDGFGIPMVPAPSCGTGACTQAVCCRTEPQNCGEADLITGLCGGAVDYFKRCEGADCSPLNCCRAPVNCREAVKSGTVVCAELPANLNLAACPFGICNSTTCCKSVETCGDADTAANGALCDSAFVMTNVSCSGSACDSATCCRAFATCGEARVAGAMTCSATKFNEGAVDSHCNPTCTTAQCCTSSITCGDAFLRNQSMCGRLTLAMHTVTMSCTDCITTCCEHVTFAPTTVAPSTAPPTTAHPTTPPTTATPNTAPTAPPTTATPTTAHPTNSTIINGAEIVSCSVGLIMLLVGLTA